MHNTENPYPEKRGSVPTSTTEKTTTTLNEALDQEIRKNRKKFMSFFER